MRDALVVPLRTLTQQVALTLRASGLIPIQVVVALRDRDPSLSFHQVIACLFAACCCGTNPN